MNQEPQWLNRATGIVEKVVDRIIPEDSGDLPNNLHPLDIDDMMPYSEELEKYFKIHPQAGELYLKTIEKATDERIKTHQANRESREKQRKALIIQYYATLFVAVLTIGICSYLSYIAILHNHTWTPIAIVGFCLVFILKILFRKFHS